MKRLLLLLACAITAVCQPNRIQLDYDDLASLLASTVQTWQTNLSANIACRTTPGDGGGGEFYFAPGATTATNIGTVFTSTGVAGRWIRKYSEQLDVKWFGATGDASTDDTTAIQGALNAATSGQTVYFSAGTYLLSDELDIPYGNIRILGAGRGATVLKSKDYTYSNLIHQNAKTNLTVESLTLRGLPNAQCIFTTNGTFASASGWTAGANWAIAAGVATHTAGSTEDLEQTFNAPPSELVSVVAHVSGRTAGSVVTKLNGVSLGSMTANSMYQDNALSHASGINTLEFTPSADFDGSIDEVYVHYEQILLDSAYSTVGEDTTVKDVRFDTYSYLAFYVPRRGRAVIDNCEFRGPNLSTQGAAVFSSFTNTHVSITKSLFSDLSSEIYTPGATTEWGGQPVYGKYHASLDVRGNVFTNNMGGIQIRWPNATIQGNHFFAGSNGSGVHTATSPLIYVGTDAVITAVTNVIIADNIGTYAGSDFVQCNTASRVWITGNLFYRSPDVSRSGSSRGIRLSGTTDYIYILNNHLYTPGDSSLYSYGVYQDSANTGNTVIENNVFGNVHYMLFFGNPGTVSPFVFARNNRIVGHQAVSGNYYLYSRSAVSCNADTNVVTQFGSISDQTLRTGANYYVQQREFLPSGWFLSSHITNGPSAWQLERPDTAPVVQMPHEGGVRLLSSTTAPSVATDQAVIYSANDGTKTVLIAKHGDGSTNKLDGSVTMPLTWLQGGLDFYKQDGWNGVTNALDAAPGTEEFSVATVLTVPASFGEVRRIWLLKASGSNFPYMMLWLNTDGSLQCSIATSNPDGRRGYYTSFGTEYAGRTVLLVVARNTSTDTITFYVDGTALTGLTYANIGSPPSFATINLTTPEHYLGYASFDSNPTQPYGWRTQIYKHAIFAGLLDATACDDLMLTWIGSSRKWGTLGATDGCILDYNLAVPVGEKIKDNSTYEQHGTLTSSDIEWIQSNNYGYLRWRTSVAAGGSMPTDVLAGDFCKSNVTFYIYDGSAWNPLN